MFRRAEGKRKAPVREMRTGAFAFWFGGGPREAKF